MILIKNERCPPLWEVETKPGPLGQDYLFILSVFAPLREYIFSPRLHSLLICARFSFLLLLDCKNRDYVFSEAVFIELKRYPGRIITAEARCTVLGSFLHGIEHPFDRKITE